MNGDTLIRDVRVFDGERLLDARQVLLRGGVIAAVGDDLPTAPGTTVVAGTDHTLLPGLIDAHTHPTPEDLAEALRFGVTTELCMFTAPDRLRERRAVAAARDDVADVRGASFGATAPDSTLSRLTPGLPAVQGPTDAAAFVAARVAEGADYLKVYLEDPRWFGHPGLSADTVRALVRAAHAHDRIAIAHADSAAMARLFLDAGGDALAHVLGDLDHGPDLVARLTRPDAFVVATLRVTALFSAAAATEVDATRDDLAHHPHLAPRLDPRTRDLITDPTILTAARARNTAAGGSRLDFAAALRSTRALHAAGVPILAGTDAAPTLGNGPARQGLRDTLGGHGIALHHELTLLVRAGLTPAEALAAATAAPARYFGLADRGRVAAGLRADLLLVAGDPTRDITDSRNITEIWRRGARLARGFDNHPASDT